jgi:hypothetical protein
VSNFGDKQGKATTLDRVSSRALFRVDEPVKSNAMLAEGIHTSTTVKDAYYTPVATTINLMPTAAPGFPIHSFDHPVEPSPGPMLIRYKQKQRAKGLLMYSASVVRLTGGTLGGFDPLMAWGHGERVGSIPIDGDELPSQTIIATWTLQDKRYSLSYKATVDLVYDTYYAPMIRALGAYDIAVQIHVTIEICRRTHE